MDTPGHLNQANGNRPNGFLFSWQRLALGMLVGVCASAGVLFAIFSWTREARRASLRQAVMSSFQEGRWDDAIRSSREWLDNFPGTVEAHEFQLEAGLRARRLPVAIEAAKALLGINPARSDLKEKVVLWLFLTGKLEEADTLCLNLRQENPDRKDLIQLHADILMRLGEGEKAGGLLDTLLRAGVKSSPVLTMRGALYLDEGNYPKAVAILREAASLPGQPSEKNLHYLALSLARTGDAKGAEAVFAQLRSRQNLEIWEKYGRPNSVAYKVSLAESMLQMEKRDEALGLLGEIRRETPDDPYVERLFATASAMPAGGRK